MSLVQTLLSLFGTGFSLALFLSPLPTINELKSRLVHGQSSQLIESLEEAAPAQAAGKGADGDSDRRVLNMVIMHLCMCVNCLLWITYGFVVMSVAITINNAIGFVLSIYYIYQCFSALGSIADKDRAISYACIGLVIYIVLLSYVTFVVSVDDIIPTLGFECAAAAICMLASPLVNLKQVLQKKNASSIAWSTTVASVANSLTWYLFGIASNDGFVEKCNLVGLIVSLLLVAVKLVYRNGSAASESKRHSDNLDTVIIGMTTKN